MASKKSSKRKESRAQYANAGLDQVNAVSRLLCVLKHSEFDGASQKSLTLLLRLERNTTTKRDAVGTAAEFVLQRRLETYYETVLAVFAAEPELAVDGFEFATEVYCDSERAAKLKLLAGLAIVSALRSTSQWVWCWNAWYKLMLSSEVASVSDAALEIAPPTALFHDLSPNQRINWIERRNCNPSYASTEQEVAVLFTALELKDSERNGERGAAMRALAQSTWKLSKEQDSRFEHMLLKFLKEPGVAHTLRSNAIVAIGLRGKASRGALSHLYPVYKENPFNLGRITAQAIARIAAACPSLPHQRDFTSHPGRSGVLGLLLDSDMRGVSAHAASAILAHPQGLAELAPRLGYLSENVGGADAKLFAEATQAVLHM